MFNLLLSANAAADWVGGIFAGILIISLIGFLGKMYFYDKTSIEKKLDDNPDSIFKFISSAGTLCEAITLSLISIQNGNTVFESFTRYSLMGMFEVVTSFWFMSVITNGIIKLSNDDNYNPITFILLIIKSLPFFIFSFAITALIHFLYLESINIVEAQQLYVGFFTSIFGLRFESDPQYFSTVNIEDVKRISIGAIIMIYSTTLVNIMLAVQQFKKYSNKFKLTFKVKKEESNKQSKEKENENKKTKDGNQSTMYDSRVNSKYSIDSLLHYLPSFSQWFTPFSESDFNTWIIEYTGYDKDKDLPVNSKINSSKIKGSTKDRGALALEILQELTNKLLGTDKNLIRGLSKIELDICEKIKTLEDSISQYKDKSSDYKSSNEGKADLSTINALYDKINNTENKRKSMKSSLLDTFQTHNFLSNSSVKNEDDITNKLASLNKTKQSL